MDIQSNVNEEKPNSGKLIAPTLVKFRFNSLGARVDQPVPVITSGGASKRPAGAAHALGLATAFLAQRNGGFNKTPGHDSRRPLSTVTNTGGQQQIVAANLVHFRGNCDARDVEDPLRTVSASGEHHAVSVAFLSRQFGASIGQSVEEPAPTVLPGGGGKTSLVQCTLSQEDEEGALRVAKFMLRFINETSPNKREASEMTTSELLALVTVVIEGISYVIVDIGLRMLTPRELYRAQGFPENYIIDRGHDGRKFTKAQQVHMCGNSVSPPTMAALARANNPWPDAYRMAA
jgi:DNA (cytosine-5)-methyltransferase 1